MKPERRLFGSRKAFVTVYIAFATFTMIPVVGLAIDFSILYNVKSRLQEACDAGAIGAGSLVQRSTDVTNPATQASIQASILRYFNANFAPVPWGATQASYSSGATQDANKVRTITVTATYNVPMEFMRVLGINNSQVAAQAIAKIRFVNLIVVVDRSGSVSRTGGVGGVPNPTIIKNDLTTFVANAATSIFVDGRDVVGLTSFGGNYNVDYGAQTHFQTSTPNIGTAITSLFFDTSNSTNTGEGLYQAWYQITQLNQPGSLNVILLMTDGRPSAFSADFPAASAPYCTDTTDKQGVITSPVNDGSAWRFPPPTSRTTSGILKTHPQCTTGGCEPSTFVSNSAGCKYYTTSAVDAYMDFPTFPALIGPQDHTTGSPVPGTTTFASTTGYFSGGGSNLSSATAVRYAAYNYAYNVAKAIRQDATYSPVIFTIGMNFDPATYPNEEPLDADYLATISNDPSYTSATKPSGVYQAGQTPGKYYNVTYDGIAGALQDITGQILRLAAH